MHTKWFKISPQHICHATTLMPQRKSTRKINPWNFEYDIIGSRMAYPISQKVGMGLLKDTQNCGLRIRRECRERFPRHRLQRKPLVSDLGMHRGTCATHMQWCMLGPLTRCGGADVPGNPGTCATRNFAYLARGPCHSSASLYRGLCLKTRIFLSNISLHFRITNHSIDFIYMTSIMFWMLFSLLGRRFLYNESNYLERFSSTISMLVSVQLFCLMSVCLSLPYVSTPCVLVVLMCRILLNDSPFISRLSMRVIIRWSSYMNYFEQIIIQYWNLRKLWFNSLADNWKQHAWRL